MEFHGAPIIQPSAPAQSIETQRAENAAEEFEALVIAQLLAPLFSSVETPEIAGGSSGQNAFGALLQEEYANSMAARGGFGIADQVKAALIDIQSQASATRNLEQG